MKPVMQMPPVGQSEACQMLKEANRVCFAHEAMKIVLQHSLSHGDGGVHIENCATIAVKLADEMVKRLYPEPYHKCHDCGQPAYIRSSQQGYICESCYQKRSS